MKHRRGIADRVKTTDWVVWYINKISTVCWRIEMIIHKNIAENTCHKLQTSKF
jgi:hypothetical protein